MEKLALAAVTAVALTAPAPALAYSWECVVADAANGGRPGSLRNTFAEKIADGWALTFNDESGELLGFDIPVSLTIHHRQGDPTQEGGAYLVMGTQGEGARTSAPLVYSLTLFYDRGSTGFTITDRDSIFVGACNRMTG